MDEQPKQTKSIYETDLTQPVSRLIEDIRNQLVRARGQLHDIQDNLGWKDRLEDVSGLLTCGLITLHHINEKVIENEITQDNKKFGQSYSFVIRGIGLDSCPCCYVCGSRVRGEDKNHYLNNISAFVKNKEQGEKIVLWFSLSDQDGARLDFREHEPHWIQVKVGACDKHKPNLENLANRCIKNHNYIRECDIAKSKKE